MWHHMTTYASTTSTEQLLSIHSIYFCSLTLKNKSLCLSVDGFHSLCYCSHISLCQCVLLNEVLDTCQVLPIVLRLQRDLGAEREEERAREKRKRVEEEGRWRGGGMGYVEVGGNGGQRKREREEEGQEERRDETEVGGKGGERRGGKRGGGGNGG